MPKWVFGVPTNHSRQVGACERMRLRKITERTWKIQTELTVALGSFFLKSHCFHFSHATVSLWWAHESYSPCATGPVLRPGLINAWAQPFCRVAVKFESYETIKRRRILTRNSRSYVSVVRIKIVSRWLSTYRIFTLNDSCVLTSWMAHSPR